MLRGCMCLALGVVRVRAPPGEIAAHHLLELAQRLRVDRDVVSEEAAQVALCPVDLVAVEEPSTDVDPEVHVRQGLGHNAQRWEEHAVARHAIAADRGGEVELEALQEVQGRKHRALARVRAVNCVGNELRERDGWIVEGGACGRRGVGVQLEDVRYETRAELGEVSVTVIRIADLCVFSFQSVLEFER